MDIAIISRQLGHASITTTARYLDHLAPTAVIDAMRRRNWVGEQARAVCGQRSHLAARLLFGTVGPPPLVVSGRLRHGGNPVLRWMASNVAVELDAAGNIKPSKKKSTERIDGIVATIMGLGRALIGKEYHEPRVMVI